MNRGLTLLLGFRCPLCGRRKRNLYPHLAVAHQVQPGEKASLVLASRARQRRGD